MTTKKTTPHTNAEDSAAVIAAHVAAILAHPDTPHNLYNALVEAVSALDAPTGFFDSKEYVELCLRGEYKARGWNGLAGGVR
jgi:hypothetical protein